MVGNVLFHLKSGERSDVISMALSLAESLVEKKGFYPVDQMERYLRCYREGYVSSIGRCFDIGGATRTALLRHERNRTLCSGSPDPASAGNGSIMNLAPVPL